MDNKWLVTKTNIEPLIIFNFDDGNNTDYSVAYQEMKSRGVVGTSYLIGNLIDRASHSLTSAQITEMYNNGWDFQDHTYEHINVANVSVSNAMKLHRNMFINRDIFKKLGLSTPEHHAYPFGAFNDTSRDIMSKYLKSMRAGYSAHVTNLQDYNNVDFGALKAINADFDTVTQLNNFKSILDYTVANNKIFMVYWHRLEGSRKDRFIEFLDYAISTGIRFVTHAEMYDILKANQKKYEFI